MTLNDSLNHLKEGFCAAISSDEKHYFDVLAQTIAYFLEKGIGVVCITWEYPAHDIFRAVDKLTNADALFFIDAISIFKDYGLPYRNFDIVNSPDLIDDIWVSINVELMRRKQRHEKTVVILDHVASLVNYLDVNETVLFLYGLIRQLKENHINIILISGVTGESVEKNLFHQIVDNIIYA